MASSSHALPVGLPLEADRRRAKASSSGLESHRVFGISCFCRIRSKAVKSRDTCSTSLLGEVSPSSLSVGTRNCSRGRGALGSIILGGVLPFWVLDQPAVAYAYNSQVYGDLSSTLVESGFQFVYLGGLLVLLGGGTFLVIRQILMRRELELAAKELQERVRTGQASPLEYYELGAIMLRKKLYPVARRYLEQAIKKWEDDEQDLAQVYNALGFCYLGDGKTELAIASYEKALTLSPGYTVAWNNLGQAYEKRNDWEKALKSYEQTLQFDPANKVALTCRKIAQEKVDMFKGIPTKL